MTRLDREKGARFISESKFIANPLGTTVRLFFQPQPFPIHSSGAAPKILG